ncbi:hypothetical protein [Caulobacter hibisci]|uniref:Uncharacterized protein n=1 Tax=Caulobacter hibisci TaxID=2035993 RepID=A0ABS0SX15_9CAUL|nr:hypothetical protein [Caulobacter hibisci]MBI1684069.1 hypothetical protein [Caulobacter hibisci]
MAERVIIIPPDVRATGSTIIVQAGCRLRQIADDPRETSEPAVSASARLFQIRCAPVIQSSIIGPMDRRSDSDTRPKSSVVFAPMNTALGRKDAWLRKNVLAGA